MCIALTSWPAGWTTEQSLPWHRHPALSASLLFAGVIIAAVRQRKAHRPVTEADAVSQHHP
jgi:hypothetical protein